MEVGCGMGLKDGGADVLVADGMSPAPRFAAGVELKTSGGPRKRPETRIG